MSNTDNKKNEFDFIKENILHWIKNWYFFAISFVVCIAVAAIYYKTATPVYNIVSKVSIRHDESLTGSGSLGKGSSILNAFGIGGSNIENIEDETIKLNSQGYVKKVIKALGLNADYTRSEFLGIKKTKLYDSSPVVISADKSIADTLNALLFFTLDIKDGQTGIKLKVNKKTVGKYSITTYPAQISTPYGEFTFSKSKFYSDKTAPYKLKIMFTSYDFMAQIYRESIEVDFEKKSSDLINFAMPSENPEVAKQYINTLIDNYNTEWNEEKNYVTLSTIDYINERLVVTSKSLAQADLDIKDFKNKYNLTDIEADIKYYFAMSGELQPAIIEAETQLNMIQTVADFISDDKNKTALIPFSGTIDNQSVSESISKYNEMLLKRNDLYKSSLQSDLAKSLDAELNNQRNVMIQTLVNVKDALALTVKNLKNKEKEMMKKLGNVPIIEQDYIRLKREQELQQTIYVFLLEMREQTGVKGVNLLPKLKMVDDPYVELKLVSPSLLKTAFLAFFFGLIALPLSIIYLKNALNKKKK